MRHIFNSSTKFYMWKVSMTQFQVNFIEKIHNLIFQGNLLIFINMKGLVYQIEIGDYKYIGSTHNLDERFYNHKNLLIKNNHYNKFLQRTYNKYKTISISILYEYNDRQDAYAKEQELLDLFYKKPFYMMEHPKAIGGSLPGKDNQNFGKKRPAHSEWMKNNGSGLSYKRTDLHIKNLKENKIGKVTCKDSSGNILIVKKEEFDLRDDLHGVSYKQDQIKLRKKVRCIEDDLVFESLKAASKYYNNIGSSSIVRSIKNNIEVGMKKLGRSIKFEYVKQFYRKDTQSAIPSAPDA